MTSLKQLVQEVVEAMSLCPESLQPLAFEILLRHQLTTATLSASERQAQPAKQADTPEPQSATAGEEATGYADEDIAPKDLHTKVRRFLQEGGLTVQDLNALYYKDGTDIKPLYDDLRSAGMSESQIRLALLEAFETALATGNFEFRGESVREKCKIHKCYDSPNFTRNFKNNATLFDGFETYDAAAPIRLSAVGRQRLGAVLAELARSS